MQKWLDMELSLIHIYFFYGNNEKKNGASIYFFADGEREEVAYKDGVLEGPAIYIFNDGTAEHYEYKNGKRVED